MEGRTPCPLWEEGSWSFRRQTSLRSRSHNTSLVSNNCRVKVRRESLRREPTSIAARKRGAVVGLVGHRPSVFHPSSSRTVLRFGSRGPWVSAPPRTTDGTGVRDSRQKVKQLIPGGTPPKAPVPLGPGVPKNQPMPTCPVEVQTQTLSTTEERSGVDTRGTQNHPAHTRPGRDKSRLERLCPRNPTE